MPARATESTITVYADIRSYADGTPASPGLIGDGPAAGANTTATILVCRSYACDTAVNTATVSINGVSLALDAAASKPYAVYAGSLMIAPGQKVDLSVTVSDKVYTISSAQFATYQLITAPSMGASISAGSPLPVAWTTEPADNKSLWVQATGGVGAVWPASYFGDEPVDVTYASSALIPGESLPAGNLLVYLCATKVVLGPNLQLSISAVQATPFTVTP